MALIQREIKRIITNRNKGKSEVGLDICSCDLCFEAYTQKICDTIYRRKGKIAEGRDICKSCIKKEHKKLIGEIGAKTLLSRTKEQVIENARSGGDSEYKI